MHARGGDGAEIFTLKKQRHAEYWMAQAFPVLLVIRNSEGEVRWMSKHDESSGDCTLEEARAAKKAALGVFERLTKVSGIGIRRSGRGYGLKINVPKVLPADVAVPEKIGGVPVRIEVIGPIKKRAA